MRWEFVEKPWVRLGLYFCLAPVGVFWWLWTTNTLRFIMEVMQTTAVSGGGPSYGDIATVAWLGGGLILLAVAWRRRFQRGWDYLAALVMFSFMFIGYLVPAPPWELAIPVLLPWALLVVELPGRHRVLLLIMQWLTSVKFLETVTGSADSMLLAALGIVHLVIVWMGLRGSKLGRVPLAFGALLGVFGLGTTLWFLAREPTWQRTVALLAPIALLAAVALMASGKLLARVKVPEVAMPPASTP